MAKKVGLAGVVSLEELGAPPGAVPREPVLAPAISQRLAPVVPATIELAIDWSAIRAARQIAKLRDPSGAPSPSSMVAWAVTQVMVINPSFRRLVLKGTLGADKDRLLAQVRQAIAEPGGAHLRPAWARGL